MRLKTASRTRSPVGRVSRPRGAKMRAPLREPAMILIAPLGLVAERSLRLDEILSPRARLGDESSIANEPRELQVGKPRLARAEKLALPTQLQIDLGELEAVRDLDERLQAALRFVGQLLLRARDEQAVGLLRSTADA